MISDYDPTVEIHYSDARIYDPMKMIMLSMLQWCGSDALAERINNGSHWQSAEPWGSSRLGYSADPLLEVCCHTAYNVTIRPQRLVAIL